MATATTSPVETAEALDKRIDLATMALCEQSLWHFVKWAWKVVEPGTPFIASWHIKAICEHLEACTRGEIRRLLITMPPRSMKSLLVSVFWPAWVWINEPDKRWIYASYAQHLSTRDSLHCRDVILSPWYQERWGDRFRLRTDQNTKVRFDNDQSGFRLASSTGGMGTGEGAWAIVADDAHNVVQSESDVERAAVLHWWDQSMSTRGNDPKTVCHVIVMQRLHENDLAGHVLEQGGYEHLLLPMEFESDRRCTTSIGWSDPRQREGELLSPKRFPPSAIAELKTRLGSYGWAGQFQQRPAPKGGGMFKRHWFKIIDARPAGPDIARIRYWDLAASVDGDYTVGCLMASRPDGTFVIEDVMRGQWGPAERDDLILQTAQLDGYMVGIALEEEPGSAGKSVTHWLTKMLQGFTVYADKPTGDKEVRAQPLAAQCEAGNVSLVNGDWCSAWLDEVTTFPNARHDDQVDASSGAFIRLTRYGPPKAPHSVRADPRPRQGIEFEGQNKIHTMRRNGGGLFPFRNGGGVPPGFRG
jgi:predicted phage terminase large subunit-like protein